MITGSVMSKPQRSGRDRGRFADAPQDVPGRGWWQVLKRTLTESKQDNLGLIAAGVAFYGFLAMVPLLGSLVLVYGLVVDASELAAHVQSLTTMVPADVVGLIEEQLQSAVETAQGKKGFGLILALGLALFGAMKGAGAIITAINVVYEETETRNLLQVTLVRAGITAGAIVLATAGVLAASVTGFLEDWASDLGSVIALLIKAVSWAVTGALGSAAVAALYRYAPDRDAAKWVWLTPGSVLAVLGIVIATLGFGIYSSNLGKFNATYGSLGAIVALLTWLYFSGYVLLLGAELNAELEHQTVQDTTTGADRPMGRRNAKMADRVADE